MSEKFETDTGLKIESIGMTEVPGIGTAKRKLTGISLDIRIT